MEMADIAKTVLQYWGWTPDVWLLRGVDGTVALKLWKQDRTTFREPPPLV